LLFLTTLRSGALICYHRRKAPHIIARPPKSENMATPLILLQIYRLSPMLEELWKSIRNWHSYGLEYSVTFPGYSGHGPVFAPTSINDKNTCKPPMCEQENNLFIITVNNLPARNINHIIHCMLCLLKTKNHNNQSCNKSVKFYKTGKEVTVPFHMQISCKNWYIAVNWISTTITYWPLFLDNTVIQNEFESYLWKKPQKCRLYFGCITSIIVNN